MTKKQRAQVVELLRCAADVRLGGVGLVGMNGAAEDLEVPFAVFNLAWDVVFLVPYPTSVGWLSSVDEGYRMQLLEAAARVDEGSWP